jgi:hypothetical protein
MNKDKLYDEELIAPCGMNCSICSGYIALKIDIKNKGVGIPYCPGCRPRDKKCAFLKKHCKLLMNHKIRFCYDCEQFPCDRLKGLDMRYRSLYHMSMIENLEFIKKIGMKNFLEKEKNKWKCPSCGGMICCHNGLCFKCDFDKLVDKKKLYRWTDE